LVPREVPNCGGLTFRAKTKDAKAIAFLFEQLSSVALKLPDQGERGEHALIKVISQDAVHRLRWN
jgi:hypothetical protein